MRYIALSPRVQYRPFVRHFSDDVQYDFRAKPAGQDGAMVLDGQQRLQSLYLALYGDHDGREVYLDIIGSGIQKASTTEHRYIFEHFKANLDFRVPGLPDGTKSALAQAGFLNASGRRGPR